MKKPSDTSSIHPKRAVMSRGLKNESRVKLPRKQNCPRASDKAFRRKYIRKIRETTCQRTQKINKKQLSLKFQNFLRVQKGELGKNRAQKFMCIICLGMLINPATTICGHIFCFKCIERLFLYQAACPICLKPARVYQIYTGSQFKKINEAFWRNSWKKRKYEKKKRQNQEWMSKRFIDPKELEVDDYIDTKDTGHIWCKARILELYQNQKNENIKVKVHYLGWNQIYDEIINTDSQRLAPFGFFTCRKTIPHYQIVNQTDQNFQAHVNFGLSTRIIFGWRVKNHFSKLQLRQARNQRRRRRRERERQRRQRRALRRRRERDEEMLRQVQSEINNVQNFSSRIMNESERMNEREGHQLRNDQNQFQREGFQVENRENNHPITSLPPRNRQTLIDFIRERIQRRAIERNRVVGSLGTENRVQEQQDANEENMRREDLSHPEPEQDQPENEQP